MSEQIGVELDIDKEVFRFQHAFDKGFLEFKDDVQEISNILQQESNYFTKLKDIEND